MVESPRLTFFFSNRTEPLLSGNFKISFVGSNFILLKKKIMEFVLYHPTNSQGQTETGARQLSYKVSSYRLEKPGPEVIKLFSCSEHEI